MWMQPPPSMGSRTRTIFCDIHPLKIYLSPEEDTSSGVRWSVKRAPMTAGPEVTDSSETVIPLSDFRHFDFFQSSPFPSPPSTAPTPTGSGMSPDSVLFNPTLLPLSPSLSLLSLRPRGLRRSDRPTSTLLVFRAPCSCFMRLSSISELSSPPWTSFESPLSSATSPGSLGGCGRGTSPSLTSSAAVRVSSGGGGGGGSASSSPSPGYAGCDGISATGVITSFPLLPSSIANPTARFELPPSWSGNSCG
mmetsp:Transcript_18233/g.51464  ORF Transcript_18233/g.51464 Transcript_18233/m.51464 type:complete len:249 (-) Transcript_18233:1484-2230(-)